MTKLYELSLRHKRFIEDVRECLYHLDAFSHRPFYEDVRFLFLSHVEHENIRTQAYDDYTGKPVLAGEKPRGHITVGVGFNMDAYGAREDWDLALGTSSSFHEVYSGKAFLSQKDVRALFNWSIHQREKILSGNLYASCWHQLRSNERLAIEDAFYNGSFSLVGSQTRFYKHILRYGASGDTPSLQRAMGELRDYSNPKNVRGVSKRRIAEALLLDSTEFLDEKTLASLGVGV